MASWSPCLSQKPDKTGRNHSLHLTDGTMDPWRSEYELAGNRSFKGIQIAPLIRKVRSRTSDEWHQGHTAGKMPSWNSNPSLSGSPVVFPRHCMMMCFVACPGSHG